MFGGWKHVVPSTPRGLDDLSDQDLFELSYRAEPHPRKTTADSASDEKAGFVSIPEWSLQMLAKLIAQERMRLEKRLRRLNKWGVQLDKLIQKEGSHGFWLKQAVVEDFISTLMQHKIMPYVVIGPSVYDALMSIPAWDKLTEEAPMGDCCRDG